MYVELKSYKNVDIFKVASKKKNAPLKVLNKSLPCNTKSWKKNIEFFLKISVTFIVKSTRREAETVFDKAVTICQNI